MAFTNDAKYQSFSGSSPKSIASSGFEGCVGLLIATTKGALLGHFVPTNDGLRIAQDKFSTKYEDHKRSLRGGTVILYGQVEVDQRTWKFPDVIQMFTNYVEDLTGQSPQYQTYLEPLETWVDDEGMPLDDADYDNFQSGGMIAINPGGGNQRTSLVFMSCTLQKHGARPPS